jgi:hypothetical protein
MLIIRVCHVSIVDVAIRDMFDLSGNDEGAVTFSAGASPQSKKTQRRTLRSSKLRSFWKRSRKTQGLLGAIHVVRGPWSERENV